MILGLPLPLVGSGCVVARRSARPFGAKRLGLRLRRPTFHPSAEKGLAVPPARAGQGFALP
ncbi:hypothetical protein SapgrDRAFT_0579 [Saprospira grandis DSM 2844]|uniref:Uncharacterized protein n=1 Tax=Saprospira grandis DSM 2844 TaxID=694433 RepID=J0P4H0_9BACT|nr:hypothetical protein SapgrDRAFT_0579 [Saprospira grandis DSM 2844]